VIGLVVGGFYLVLVGTGLWAVCRAQTRMPPMHTPPKREEESE